MGDRKIVEAFRVFFEKSVVPYIGQNDNIMKEWNHLLKIVGNDPIDYNQLDFYLLLANKNTGGSGIQSPQKGGNNPGSSNKIEQQRFRQSDFNQQNNKIMVQRKISQNTSQQQQNGLVMKKRNLLTNLQNFQKMLIGNQQRLENMNKKQTPIQNTSTYSYPSNGMPIRRI